MFRNKILYFMVLVEVCLLCVLYNAYQPVVLLWLVVLLPVMLKLLVVISGFFVKVRILEEYPIVTRQGRVCIGAELLNKGILPVGQVMLFGSIDGKEFSCMGKQITANRVMLEYPVECHKCGIKTVKIKKVYLFDLLKLTKKVIRINKNIEITVIPKIYYADEGRLDGNVELDIESNTYSDNVPGQDPSEIFDIREYREGDKLSRIHWKLSEKMDKIMVKEYSRPLLDGVQIILDTQNPLDNVDVAFSVGLHVVEKKGIAWVNEVKTTITEEYIKEFVAGVAECGKITYLEKIAEGYRTLESCRVLCCFDEINKDEAKHLNLVGENAKVYLLCNKVKEDVRMQLFNVEVLNLLEMDALLAVERIINE